MTTLVGDSSHESDYPSMVTSRSTSVASSCSINLEDYSFVGVTNMQDIVKRQCDKLLSGESSEQFLTFKDVTEAGLFEIDEARNQIGKCIRLQHFKEKNMLFVKLMPSASHEVFHREVCYLIRFAFDAMGVRRGELLDVGGGRFSGGDSSNEADSALKPIAFRNGKSDWPTLVIESGLSQSVRELEAAARWWLENSQEQVKIVLLISINSAQKSLSLYKWELVETARRRRPSTRAESSQTGLRNARCVQEIKISPPHVSGAPLLIEFEKVYLRPCVPPENNISFSRDDLLQYSAMCWAGLT